MKNKSPRLLALLLFAVFLAAAFAGCASGSASQNYAKDGSAPSATYAATTAAAMTGKGIAGDGLSYSNESAAAPGQDNGSLFNPGDNRKMIRNANISIQTERFSESVDALYASISAVGGFLENLSSSGGQSIQGYSRRYLNAVVRVPAERLDEFITATEGFGAVQSSDIGGQDVTFTYVDMEARLATLRTKQERLLDLLSKATRMSDIIELETALSDTLYQIENYTSSLSKLDERIAYSSVSIYLQEVQRETPVQEIPKTLGQRITARFKDSVSAVSDFGENLLIFVVGESPTLILLAICVVAIVFIVRAYSRRNRRKYDEYMANKNKTAYPPKDDENKPE